MRRRVGRAENIQLFLWTDIPPYTKNGLLLRRPMWIRLGAAVPRRVLPLYNDLEVNRYDNDLGYAVCTSISWSGNSPLMKYQASAAGLNLRMDVWLKRGTPL